MKMHDDLTFVAQLADPQAREKAIGQCRTQRTFTLLASCCLLVLAVLSLLGKQPGLCGLLSGIAAMNYAVVLYCDIRIKIALLMAEMKKE